MKKLLHEEQALRISPVIAAKLTKGADALLRIVKPANEGAVRTALYKYSVTELKGICSGLGLRVGGKKAELIQRLAEHEFTNSGSVPMPTINTKAHSDAESRAKVGAREQPQKLPRSTAKRSKATTWQVVGLVTLLLLIWALSR